LDDPAPGRPGVAVPARPAAWSCSVTVRPARFKDVRALSVALATVLAMASPAQPDDLQPSPVDAVVFDLGNVLIRWDPHAAIAPAVGPDEATRFLADEAFAFSEWNHAQDAGRDWQEAEDAAVAAHPHWEPAIRGYRQNFAASLTGQIDDTVTLLEELHAAGVRLYALTNWSEELFPAALDRFGFLGLFEDIIVSGEEAVAKPDPEIFEVLEDRVGHALDDCIFIDDSPRNVEAAAAAGMDAIHFTDTGHLREDLHVRGLPVAPVRPGGGPA
jgi:2-haloacid dehalogenase